MEFDNDMDAFIRDTLRSSRRVREKNFDPVQTTVTTTSTSSSNYSETQIPFLDLPAISGSVHGGGSGSDIQFPFRITTINGVFGSGQAPEYKVSYNSSIINGTNGGPYNIVGLNEDKRIEEEKFIVAEADITSPSLTVTNGFTIKEVDANETDEIVTENEEVFGVTRPVQKKLRLLIGKITVENVDDGINLKAWQAITTSYRTVIGIHNSIPVLVLEPAPTHQSRI